MRFLLDFVYLLALLILFPWLIYKAITTGKHRRCIWVKFTGRLSDSAIRTQHSGHCKVWFHGVSVGEIHLLRQVVTRFRLRHPECQVVISTTTDTGYAEARKHFSELPIFYWPFDFSWAARKPLRTVVPSLTVFYQGAACPT